MRVYKSVAHVVVSGIQIYTRIHNLRYFELIYCCSDLIS